MAVKVFNNVNKYSVNFFKNLEKGLFKAGLFYEGEVKKRTPVDTGRLKSSIDTRPKGLLKVSVGTDVEYAPFVEFGTSRQRPQAMFREALAQNKDKIVRLIGNETKKTKV